MSYCGITNLTTIDSNYLQKIYSEKSWAWWLNHIGTFVVFIIGLCGNILSLIVLCRRPFIRNSYTQYLIALAIADTGAIFSETIAALDEVYQYQDIGQRTFIQHTVSSCKFYYYIRFIFYSMSSWIVVALAVERLVAIKFPLWAKYVCSVRNARRIILFILSFTMMIQSYHLVVKGLDCAPSSSSMLNSTDTCRCKTLPDYATLDILFTIYLWRLILMTFIPLTVIITVNVLIVNQLSNEKCFLDHTNTANNARQKLLVLYKVSRMLVIISSVYLLLHVPGSSLEVVKYMFVHVFQICQLKWQYYIHVTHQIFDLLTNLNYGINFYLYIISGQNIRTELMRRQSLFRLSTLIDYRKFRRSSYSTLSHRPSLKTNQRRLSNVKPLRCAAVSSV